MTAKGVANNVKLGVKLHVCPSQSLLNWDFVGRFYFLPSTGLPNQGIKRKHDLMWVCVI